MENCIARGISNPPSIQPLDLFPKRIRSIHGEIPSQFINSGLSFRHTPSLRLATCRATSSGRNPYGKDKLERDGVTIVEGARSEDCDAELNEVQQEGSFVENPLQLFKFLDEFDVKFDYEETYQLLVFGGGAAVALWFAVAILGAIDSIPLLPKLLELVGLGYTVWFSSRYLIFKEKRDELFAQVEQVKLEVLGSKHD